MPNKTERRAASEACAPSTPKGDFQNQATTKDQPDQSWWEETREAQDYSLQTHSGHGMLQFVELTLSEFNACKRLVAELRGLTPSVEERRRGDVARAGELTITCDDQKHFDDLTVCHRLLKSDRGDSTPFENFVDSLLMFYSVGRIDPDSVRMEYENFLENHDSAVDDVRMFLLHHPELASEIASEAHMEMDRLKAAHDAKMPALRRDSTARPS